MVGAGGRLASGHGTGHVVVWEPMFDDMGKQQQANYVPRELQSASAEGRLWKNKSHSGPVVALAWSLNGTTLASCDYQDIIVWHAESGVELCRTTKIGCMCLAFRPDGSQSHLACGSHTGEAWILSGLPTKRLDQMNAPPALIDTPMVAEASEEGSHSQAAFRSSHAYRSSKGCRPDCNVCSIAWSPDGQYLASASSDGLVFLWEFSGGHCPAPSVKLTWNLRAHEHRLFGLTWPQRAPGPISSDVSGRSIAWDVCGSKRDAAVRSQQEPKMSYPDAGLQVSFSDPLTVDYDRQTRWAWNTIDRSVGKLTSQLLKRGGAHDADKDIMILPDYATAVTFGCSAKVSGNIGRHSALVTGRKPLATSGNLLKDTCGVVLSDKGVAVNSKCKAVALALTDAGEVLVCKYPTRVRSGAGSDAKHLRMAEALSVAWAPGAHSYANPLLAILAGDTLHLDEMDEVIRNNHGVVGVSSFQGQLPLHVLLSRPQLKIRYTKKGKEDALTALAAAELLKTAVLTLLDHHKDAVFSVDCAGNLPLHLAACHSSVSASLFEDLMKENPEAIRRRQTDMYLPLHLLLMSPTAQMEPLGQEMVKLLLCRAPEHASERMPAGDVSVAGRLPARVAVERRATSAILRLLLEQYPAAAHEETPAGSGIYLLDMVLRQHPISEEAVVALLKHGPPSTIFKAVRVPEAAQAVGTIIADKPTLAWTMQQSRVGLIRAMDDATVECRQAMQAALYFLGRYDIDTGPPAHISATCVLLFATDHSEQDVRRRNRGRLVALKLMTQADQFMTEISCREKLKNTFRVLPILEVHRDGKAGARLEGKTMMHGSVSSALRSALKRKQEELEADEAAERETSYLSKDGGTRSIYPLTGPSTLEAPSADYGPHQSDDSGDDALLATDSEEDPGTPGSDAGLRSSGEADRAEDVPADGLAGKELQQLAAVQHGLQSSDDEHCQQDAIPDHCPAVPSRMEAQSTEHLGAYLQVVLQPWLSLEQSVYCMAMERADRNLTTAILHERFAGNLQQLSMIKYVVDEVAQALRDMHQELIAHCDVKPLNVVRVQQQDWRLIDLDVSCEFGKPFGTKIPSSGYCPSEVARLLLQCPKPSAIQDTRTNPLSEYRASAAYDMWSFGCVLFLLCTGETLWQTDQDDHVQRSDLEAIAELSSDHRSILDRRLLLVKQRLGSNETQSALALDLLLRLLQPEESLRLGHSGEGAGHPSGFHNFDEVLRHPFMPQGAAGGQQEESARMISELRRVHASMEAKLDGIGSRLLSMDNKLDQLCRESDIHSRMLTELLLRNPKMPNLVVLLPVVDPGPGPSNLPFRRGQKLVGSLAGWMQRPLGRLMGKEMRLVFVCELSQRLADREFKVEVKPEWLKRAAPYLRTGLKAVRLGLAAARLAGLPVPDIPAELEKWLGRVQEEVQHLVGEGAADDIGGRLEEAMKTVEDEASRQTQQTDQTALSMPASNEEGVSRLLAKSPWLAELKKNMKELSEEVLDSLLHGHKDWKQNTGLIAQQVGGTAVWCRPDEAQGFKAGTAEGSPDGRLPAAERPAHSKAEAQPPPRLGEDRLDQMTAALAALQATVEEALRRPALSQHPVDSRPPSQTVSPTRPPLPPLAQPAASLNAGSPPHLLAAPNRERFSSVPKACAGAIQPRPLSAPRPRSLTGQEPAKPGLRPSSAAGRQSSDGSREPQRRRRMTASGEHVLPSLEPLR